jgi:hypothetical protein
VIHSLSQAEAALRAAAAADTAVELWSAEGAAAYAGAGWFKALVEEAARRVPEARFTSVLDCADLPGYALGAIRIGVAAIAYTGPAQTARKIADIASQTGCRLVQARPAVRLDLRDVAEPYEACLDWLERGAPRRAKSSQPRGRP